jgi:hypothetical protein
MGIFIFLFGYSEDGLAIDSVLKLIKLNLIILIIWLFFVSLVIKTWPKQWRDYGWISSPAMLVLILLVNFSWAKPTLESNILEKSNLVEISIPNSVLKLYAVYPQQIIDDEQNTATIMLWSDNAVPCTLKKIRLSSDGLVFALQPTDGSSFQWQRALEIKMPYTDSTLLAHVQPLHIAEDTQEVYIEIVINNEEPQKLPPIRIEGRQDTQTRLWKSALLDAGSISIIIGIVAAWIEIRRKQEEERREEEGEIYNALEEFDGVMKNDFSKGINDWGRLLKNWEKWDQTLQDQIREKFNVFVENNLWDASSGKTIAEMKEDAALLFQVCGRIFKEQEKSVFTLQTRQSALRMDENSPRALLYLLKEHPVSINAAKIIAGAFPLGLKERTIIEYSREFPEQINALRAELGFWETEHFPLQEQFAFHSKPHTAPDKLTAWLNARSLNCSPFADACSPFYSAFDGQLLADWAAPGFQFPVSSFEQVTLKFENAWDAGAAAYEYCKAFQSNSRVKDDVFFAMITPGIVRDYEPDHPRKLYLHALAEQWIWSLAEAKTLFYSMNSEERDLAGRLLRWHDFYASITVRKISAIANHFQKKKKENEKEKEILESFLENMRRWLSSASAEDLRREEINALIGLRPAPKQRTVFLISSVDLNPHAAEQISFSLHQTLSEQADWLAARNCGLVSFRMGGEGRQTVSKRTLVNQCNIRVQKCSKEESLVFNRLFEDPGREPDAILAEKAQGSPGKMVRLGQKLLLQHVERYPPGESLHIEDLIALE